MRLSTNKIPQPIITKVANFYIIHATSVATFHDFVKINKKSGLRKGPIRFPIFKQPFATCGEWIGQR